MNDKTLISQSASLPDADVIRRTAEEVIQRPDYQLDPVGSGTTFLELFYRILFWLIRPFIWLFDAMEGLPFWLRWFVVIGLVVLLVALITHIIYTFVMALRGPKRSKAFGTGEHAAIFDPLAWERQVEAEVAEGNYIAAIRLLHRACLLRLERFEKRAFRPGMTNREHLRRYRNTPLFDSMKRIVDIIDSKWYGDESCRLEDYEVCQSAHQRICDLMKVTANVQRA